MSIYNIQSAISLLCDNLHRIYLVYGFVQVLISSWRIIRHCKLTRESFVLACRQEIAAILREEFSTIINRYIISSDNTITPFSKKNKIWVCWFQGENNMPPIVRKCYNSLLKNANGHDVVLITSENMSEWVVLPDLIMRKFKEGKISYTFLSDIYRMSLLEKYGGLWIDATYWVTRPIDIDGSLLYTLKQDDRTTVHVSKSQWATNCIGCGSPYYVFSFVKECLIEYYTRHDYSIAYLLFDYVIQIAYDSFQDFHVLIDNQPYRCPDILTLQYILFDPYDRDKIEQLFRNNAMLKLTYKFDENLSRKGEFTNYDYIISL